MIRLELSDDDAKLLREILDSDLSELGYEIANTDGHDYRERLKEKQRRLRALIGQLGDGDR